MSQNGPRPASLDQRPINLNDPYEVEHWARLFHVTQLDVVIAVQMAGPMPADVALALSGPASPRPRFGAETH